MKGHQRSATFVTAKALLLGDSAVGKTGLLHRLRNESFSPTVSTHGLTVDHLQVPREIVGPADMTPNGDFHARLELWDLAGQPDYNVIHQLFIERVNVALFVIDEMALRPLESVATWSRMLTRQSPDLHAKMLVSARVDRGRLADSITDSWVESEGFSAFLRTSAKTGQGIDELKEMLFRFIDWSRIPRRIMPLSWWSVRELLENAKRNNRALLSIEEIHRESAAQEFSTSELDAILNLLHNQGEIFLLHPRSNEAYVLTRPEILNQYGSSIVIAARTNSHGPGELSEADILRAEFDLRGVDRLPAGYERLLLDSVVSLLAQSGACRRANGKLIFDNFLPSRESTKEIKCFLSHNSADKPVVEELAQRLLDSGIDVWFDKWEMLAGESLTSKIEEGIADANAFIIVMSPNSMKAKWVREELRMAIQRRLNDADFALIPVLLKDCEIPGFLRDYLYVDWRSDQDSAFEFLVNSLRGLKSKPQEKAH